MDNRPTDEDILAFSQSVTEKIAEHTPLVSQRQSIDALKAEYQNGNPIFNTKIDALGSEAYFYRVRGDGNCFYRAFAFGIIRQAQQDGSAAVEILRLKFLAAAEQMTMDKIVFEDFLETTIQLLSVPDLLRSMNDPEESNSAVVFLRFLTSDYIKAHSDDYTPYLDEGEVLDRWCERWVDPMGAEADNLQINGLINALGMGVDIVNLDRTEGHEANTHEMRPNDAQADQVIRLLYRPGHYDCLF